MSWCPARARIRLAPLLFIVPLLLLSGACGGDDDDPVTATSATGVVATSTESAGGATSAATSTTAATMAATSASTIMPATATIGESAAGTATVAPPCGPTTATQQPAPPGCLPPEPEGEGPCSLLTVDEVAAAAGEDVLETESFSDGTLIGECVWHIEPEESFKTISIFNFGSDMSISDLGRPEDAETITGLGDDAFWNPGLSSLLVQHGDTFFSVQVLIDSGDLDVDLQIAQELAARVLERL